MKSRLIILALLAVLWAGGIAARLHHLQVLEHEDYAQRAERQQQRVVEIHPPRGTIYDARGRELAVSLEVASAFAVPRAIEDPQATAAALAPVLEMEPSELLPSLEGTGEFAWLRRKLDPPMEAAVRALDLPGVHFVREYKRYYPLGETAASVLGFVGVDDQGLAGLEYQYNSEISGKRGERTVLRDARLGALSTPSLPPSNAEPGQDLRLTLDASIQFIAEQELAKAVKHHQARSGSAILLDPTTGAVLAMANYPGFNANHADSVDRSSGAHRNRVIQDVYEPGSTFKMVTAAAALEARVVRPDEVFDCQMGSITLHGIRIGDHKPFGDLTFRQVLAKSSNVGVIKTALRLPREDFYAAIQAFGFGRLTGIDLPGESPGILRPLEQWQALDPAYISFGQGIAVTPLQLARSFAAVANGGFLLQPHVVDAVGEEGDWWRLHATPPVVGKPLTPATARLLTELLEGVVQTGATGHRGAIAGYRVAGKTGTAETAADGGGYSSSRFVPSFVGFAPVERPRLVGLVVIDSPRSGSIGGGLVAAPVFSDIAGRALLYLGVTPDGPEEGPWGEQHVAQLTAGDPRES
ncbi:MAG: penicillin-binding protein 2 [Acidobacteriota bacterium]|nr:penicillin-binding protein 2 [Acidobacteriota bacterium]